MSENIFAQLQALSTMNADTSVVSARKQLNEIVRIFKERPTYLEEVTWFAELVRYLDVKTLLDCDSFMVQENELMNLLPEELQHDSLGFCKGPYYVFDGRYVYPVKDIKGDVMGFVGYDKFSSVKYLDSFNYGYRAKSYSMWGMEKLPEYYRSDEPVYFVEGVVCALYLRQEGLQALATLGSIISPYVTEIIRRFGMRAVMVNDSDEAGTACKRTMRKRIPYLRCVQSRIAKDVDDSRQENEDFVEELRKLKNPFYRSPLFK